MERPISVSVPSIMYYVSAGAGFLGTIALIMFYFFADAMFDIIIPEIQQQAGTEMLVQIFTALGGMVFLLLAVFVLAFAVVDLFIAKGLWLGKQWARILIWVLSGLSFVAAVSSFDVLGLLWHGIILYFMIFDKNAQKFFVQPRKNSRSRADHHAQK